VHAGKLRDKLREYYLTDGRDAPLRIELVKGGYVPAFRLQSAPTLEKEAPAQGPQALEEVALGAIFIGRGQGPVQTRSLVVLPFLNLSQKPTASISATA